MAPFNVARTKVQLKLSVQRTKLLQEKKESIAKKNRREIASLLERNKLETARIRAEGLIAEDVHIELLELLELYCELLLARFPILELANAQPDPSISEAVTGIIHAAPRTELRELHMLREMLMAKFGRPFSIAAMENKDDCVSPRILSKLNAATPGVDLVEAYLTEIARAYGVPYGPTDVEASGETTKVLEDTAAVDDEKRDGRQGLEELSLGAQGAGTEGRLPGVASGTPVGDPTAAVAPSKPSNEQDEFEALAARFAALKKR